MNSSYANFSLSALLFLPRDAHPEVTRINADSSLDTACYEDFR